MHSCLQIIYSSIMYNPLYVTQKLAHSAMTILQYGFCIYDICVQSKDIYCVSALFCIMTIFIILIVTAHKYAGTRENLINALN